MMQIKRSNSICAILWVVSLAFVVGIVLAGFTTPKLLAQYIPAGFVVDENHSSTQNVGMFTTTGVVARKTNELPKPFDSPRFSDLSLGYVESSNPAYVEPMWQEALQKAEEESKTQTSPVKRFMEKEAIIGGGEIYWYQGKNFNAQGAKGEVSEVTFYAATIVKQIGKGVLTIKITDYVGDRNAIRKVFR